MKIFDLNPKRAAIRFAIIFPIVTGLIYFTPLGEAMGITGNDPSLSSYNYSAEYGVAATNFYEANGENVQLSLTCYDGVHGLYVERPDQEWAAGDIPRSVMVSLYDEHGVDDPSKAMEHVDLSLWNESNIPTMIFNENEGFATDIPLAMMQGAQVAYVGVMPVNDMNPIDNARQAPTVYRFEIDNRGRELVKKYLQREGC